KDHASSECGGVAICGGRRGTAANNRDLHIASVAGATASDLERALRRGRADSNIGRTAEYERIARYYCRIGANRGGIREWPRWAWAGMWHAAGVGAYIGVVRPCITPITCPRSDG